MSAQRLKSKGMLVTFEGTEGAGKSTLIREVAQVLTSKKIPYTVTREPGGTPVAEKIRALLLSEQMDPRTELFLYEAARAEHLHQVILPAMKRGEIILCDRFTDSTLAYQAHARGLPWKEVEALNHSATRGLTPDRTVFLDIDPEVGLRRARDKNRFEAEGVAFQRKVRQGFLKSRRLSPRRWLTLAADSGSPAALAKQVAEDLMKAMVRRG